MSADDFNPRPREGGDAFGVELSLSQFDFNPRPREGGDHLPQPDGRRKLISIHAPVKGATCDPQGLRSSPRNFNPRPREGGDSDDALYTTDPSDFNPRPREGGDQ